jgi:hypothetical protein
MFVKIFQFQETKLCDVHYFIKYIQYDATLVKKVK